MLLGVTGGIATGKSTVSRMLAESTDFVVFDADACVHDLLAGDEQVRASVARLFGLPQPEPGQPVDRGALREIVFSDPAKRRSLEEILHPAVRRHWHSLLEDCRGQNRNFLADIPLLFETGAEIFFDATLVVAASRATQQSRLAARGVNPALVEAMLASQWPIGQKVGAAGFVIWNDGSLAALRRQVSLLLENLNRRAA
jgi:dephospho-CoA kinase